MNDLDPNSPQPNQYPWIRPMPVMWLCVIICIALIILGTWLSRQQPKTPATPPATPQQSPATPASNGSDYPA